MKFNNPYEDLPTPKNDRISQKSREMKRKELPPKRNRNVAPVDHAAATKKLKNILAQCNSEQSTHDDLINSLPSFKDSKNNFVNHMKQQNVPNGKLAYSMATNKHRGFS